jgi:alpha-D-ribose 1-methylphosphonate 5-triphosphate synthase subunit PhnH
MSTAPSDFARRTAASGPAFPDPVFDAQRTFRAVMAAVAEPGTIHSIASSVRCPGFSPAMTALALTLADFETSVWTDAGPEAAAYLGFHTGTTVVAAPGAADFAFITAPSAMPPLASYKQGTLEYPDTSCTLVLDVASIDPTRGWTLRGPGIAGRGRLSVMPLRAGLEADLEVNRRSFPLGVDLIFCAGAQIAALPRSTSLERREE